MGEQPLPVPGVDPPPDTTQLDRAERIEALRALGPAAREPSTALDRLTRLAAELLGAGSAQVSILLSERQVVPSAFGSAGADIDGGTPLPESLCTVAAAYGDTLVVEHAAVHPWVAGLPPVVSGAVGSYCGVPLRTQAGQVVGVLCVFDPEPRAFPAAGVSVLRELGAAVMTELELRAANRSLEAAAARLDRIVNAADLAGWEWRIPSNELIWDDQMHELFAVDRDAWGHTIEDFFARLHPEDRDRTAEVLGVARASCSTYEAEYRVIVGEGQWRWIHAWGRALRGRSGVAERIVGVAVDSTRLRLERDHIARALEHMTDGFLSLDAALRIEYLNGTAVGLFGQSRDDLLGATLDDLVTEGAAQAYRRAVDDAMATGQTITFERIDPATNRWWEVRVLPLASGAAVYLHEITQRKAREIERSELLAHHQTVSLALQAAVIPERLPVLDGVGLAARYRPADAEVQVGGDWYDAFSLDPGKVILAVGDVAGHGLAAASVMGQLRNALRAFVLLGKGPGRVLQRLNELLVRMEPTAMATIWLAELDLETRTLTWSSAGHPPPVLRRSGAADLLVGRANPPIGAAAVGQDMRQFECRLAAGDVLVAYTDGLIERRGEPLDDGIARLVGAVAAGEQPNLDARLDAVLATALAGTIVGDDVCALAVVLRD